MSSYFEQPHAARADGVAEITGPYGPIGVSEAVIQRLWGRGVFVGIDVTLASGKNFRLVSPGRANRQEGPDFIEAEWMEDGERVCGDVEIHFYAGDWKAHGHDRASAFSRVRLHALVFPPKPGESRAVTVSGYEPPEFVLLPYLPEDLESVALEDALSRSEGRPDALVAQLAALMPEMRDALLTAAARDRWDAKVAFAKRRVLADGADGSLHGMFLETLGLRRNRAPMAAIAAAHPPADFLHMTPESLFAEQGGRWRLAGVRPANHPLARLAAYSALNHGNPGWIAALREEFSTHAMYPATHDTALFRRRSGYSARRSRIRERHLAGAVGGTRFDTLVVDALLPWHSAVTGVDHFLLWRHWALGDAPDRFLETLSALGLVGRTRPATNGAFQALLALAMRP